MLLFAHGVNVVNGILKYDMQPTKYSLLTPGRSQAILKIQIKKTLN